MSTSGSEGSLLEPISNYELMTNDIDEINDAINLQKQMKEMRQLNDRLIEELASIKKQYNEAILMTQGMSELHQKLSLLSHDLRESNAQRDDYARRLDISLQKNDELQKKLDDKQKEDSFPSFKQFMEKNQKKPHTNQKDQAQYTKQIQDLTEQLENQRIENQKYAQQIKSLIDSANNYFTDANFLNYQTLHCFLSSNTQEKENLKLQNSFNRQIQELAEKTQKAVKKLKIAVKAKEAAEAHAMQVESENSLLHSKAESQISTCELKIEELQRSLQRNEIQYKQIIKSNQDTIHSHEETIQKLKNKLEEQKSKVHDFQFSPANLSDTSSNDYYDISQKIQQLESEIQNKDKTISDLNQQNSSLLLQLKTSNNSREILKKKVHSLQEDVNNLNNTNDDLKQLVSSLEIKKQSLDDQLQSAKSQLQAAYSSFKQAEVTSTQNEAKRNREKAATVFLEKIIEKQKDEIEKIFDERRKLILIIQKQVSLLRTTENLLNQQKNQIRSFEERLLDKNASTNGNYLSNDLISSTHWFIPEYPRDLMPLVTEIAKNESLPLPLKLKHVLTTIVKYFTNKSQEQSQVIHDFGLENSNLRTILEYLQNNLSKVLETSVELLPNIPNIRNYSSSFDNQINDDNNSSLLKAAKSLIEKIEQLQNEKIQISNQKTKYNAIIGEICNKINCVNREAVSEKIDELLSITNNLETDLKNEKVKNKKNRHSFKTTIEFEENIIGQLKREKYDLEQTINQNMAEISTLNQQNNELRTLNSQLKNEIEKIKRDNLQAIEDIEEKKEEEIEQMKRDIIKEKELNRQNLESLAQEKIKIELLNNRLMQEIKEWKDATQILENKNKEKEEEIIKISEDQEEKEHLLREKSNKEKNQIKAQYQSALNSLKLKNTELRQLIDKATNALNVSEEEKQVLQEKIDQFETSIEEYKRKYEAIKEELSREKQLIDNKINGIKLSEEIEYERKIENIQEKVNNEKKRIISIIIKHFHEKIDPRKPIDEESIEKIFSTINDELKNYQSTDSSLRKLLGLSPKESIPDAIEHILVSFYQSN